MKDFVNDSEVNNLAKVFQNAIKKVVLLFFTKFYK